MHNFAHKRSKSSAAAVSAFVVSRWVVSLLASVLCLVVGCGRGTPRTMPVNGVVIFQGSPLADADVAFTPTGGRPATGRTDAAGRFTLTTFKTNDGAVIGQHVVTVCKHVKKNSNTTGPYVDYVQVTPVHFGRPGESPLRADVVSKGRNEFTFDITPVK